MKKQLITITDNTGNIVRETIGTMDDAMAILASEQKLAGFKGQSVSLKTKTIG